jgi:hypothetical protein
LTRITLLTLLTLLTLRPRLTLGALWPLLTLGALRPLLTLGPGGDIINRCFQCIKHLIKLLRADDVAILKYVGYLCLRECRPSQ